MHHIRMLPGHASPSPRPSPHRMGRGRSRCWFAAAALGLFSIFAQAQPYIPGTTYFGRSNYIEYATGDLPFIMSAPHGGTLNPTEMPDRTNCPSCSGWDFSTTTDTATDDVAAKVNAEIGKLTGHLPHIIICHLDRNKIDCNREVVEGAQGDPEAVIAWNEFQGFINSASNNVITNFSKGFYIDQHGQGHPEQRLELGYLLDKYELTNTDAYMDSHSSTFKNTSSIRTLANLVSNVTSFSQLLRGQNSFGAFMVAEGYPATPSLTIPAPFTNPTSSSNFFNGGYNTDVHGSISGGPLNAMQIEANYTGVRDTSGNRTAYAAAVARTLEKFFATHYGINLRTCAPKVWPSGTGSWNSTSSWADGVLPVGTNRIVFTGSSGTSTLNITALSTSALHSITFNSWGTPTGYTLAGNPVTLIAGVSNFSGGAHSFNIPVTLAAPQAFSASPGALNFYANVTNSGNHLICIGNVAINGVISGGGGLTKSGLGGLVLAANNTYNGPTTNESGSISLYNTSTFGNASGALVLAGGDILVKNTRSTAPISNPLVMTADATISGDSTLTNSTRIVPFSANSITTVGGTLTIRNAGNNATATNNAFRVRFTGGGFNFTQPIVVGHASDLPVAISQLESFNDNLVGDQTFNGVISGTGQFRRDISNGVTAGRTILTGANTYTGGTLVQAGTLLVNNTTGSGTGSGGVTVSNAGTLGGTGTISGAVVCAGVISPGQSAGTLTLGGLDLSSGGTNVWELASLSTTGEGTNFDQLVLTGGNLALGGNAKLQINFIGSAAAPDGANAFWQGVRSWKIISLTGSATNIGFTTFPAILDGSFGAGSFTNFTDMSGSVWLKYLPTNAFTRPLISPNVPGAGTTNATLQWSAIEGQTYQLQSKDDLTTPVWTVVATVIAPTNAASFTDTNAPATQRFYRVVIP